MPTRGSTTILAPLVTLAFSAVMVLPCLCATAMAQDVEPTVGDEAECCPETGESEEGPGESDDECCCDGATSCASDVDDALSGIDAVTSSYDESDIDEPTTWWTPDLVATLWLIDVLTDVPSPDPSEHFEPDDVRPDESGTYLKTATLLI